VEPLASRMDRPYCDFADLIDCDEGEGDMAATCAPAVAVALLAAQDETDS
jgi:hypothetical protein